MRSILIKLYPHEPKFLHVADVMSAIKGGQDWEKRKEFHYKKFEDNYINEVEKIAEFCYRFKKSVHKVLKYFVCYEIMEYPENANENQQ